MAMPGLPGFLERMHRLEEFRSRNVGWKYDALIDAFDEHEAELNAQKPYPGDPSDPVIGLWQQRFIGGYIPKLMPKGSILSFDEMWDDHDYARKLQGLGPLT